jgi:hypothetical protein
MIKSKLFLLAIFSLSLLTRTEADGTSPLPAPDSPPDYAIESGVLYPGTTVQALLAAAEAEAGVAIEGAYADGYKSGLLEAAPEREYWKTMAGKWKTQARDLFLTGVSTGAVTSAAIIILIHFIAR